jgi:hypothetical protein
MKRVLLTLAILVTGMWSQAEAFGFEGHRVAWFYNNGYLVQDMRTGVWSETINSAETFYFKETSRNDTYVQLLDTSRNLEVRLYRDAMQLKGANETQYHTHVSGHWDGRRMFWYYGQPGKTGYFLLIGGGMYRMVEQGGAQATSTYLREKYRNDDHVYLLDPRTNTTYALHDTELYRGTLGGTAAFLESQGMWK